MTRAQSFTSCTSLVLSTLSRINAASAPHMAWHDALPTLNEAKTAVYHIKPD